MFRLQSPAGPASSAYNVTNLVPALKLLRSFDGVPGLTELEYQVPRRHHFVRTLPMPPCLSLLMLKSSAFPFAHLLPHGLGILEERIDKIYNEERAQVRLGVYVVWGWLDS